MFDITIYRFDENINKLQSIASTKDNLSGSNDESHKYDNKNTINTIMLQVATSCYNKLNVQRMFNHTLYKFSDMIICAKSIAGFNTDIIVCVMINSNNASDISELIDLINAIVSDIQHDKDNLFYTSYQEMLDSNIHKYRSIIQNNPIKRIRNNTTEIKSNMQSNIAALERQGEMLKNIERSSSNVADESSSILDKIKKINAKIDCNIM